MIVVAIPLNNVPIPLSNVLIVFIPTPMYLKLAWRNIWRNRRRTLITVSSITFAVLFAVLMRSVGEGSYDQMIDNMARFHTGFLQIQDRHHDEEPSLDNAMPFDEDFGQRILRADDRIDFIVPRIEAYMLVSGDEITRGGLLLGVDPDREHRLNGLRDNLVEGSFISPGDESLLVGQGFARRLNVTVGDTLILLGQGRFGMSAAGKYPIAGLVQHPVTDLDNQIVYISLPDAQWLLSAEGHVTSLLVTPTRIRFTEAVAEMLRHQLADESEFAVLTWTEMMPELLQAIEFDRTSLLFITGVLYVVIGFGLFGTILTMTLERLREFGVLLSVGMQRLQLGFVVFLETLFISILGVFTGFLVSYPLLAWFYFNPVRLTGDAAETMLEFGVEPILPISMAPYVFYSQMLVVFVIALLVSVYPVLKLQRLNILEAART